MKRTYEERLIAGLLAMGYRQVPSRSHYKEFVSDTSRDSLFVGSAGALRLGRCASASHSIGDPTRQTKFYANVLAHGDQAIGQIVNGPAFE